MVSRYYRIGADILAVLVIVAILAALLLPKIQRTWNDGAFERLREALRTIERNLAADDPATKLDPRDFIPRSIGLEIEAPTREAERLVERHGVLVRWHQNGAFSDVLFYPVALSDKIVIEPRSNSDPTPQIVLVPVDQIDLETLPNLHGCVNMTAAQTRICQLRRMKALFAAHGFDYAITLRSDGSVRWIRVEDLYKQDAEQQPSK